MTKIVRMLQNNLVVTFLGALLLVEVWSLMVVSPIAPITEEEAQSEMTLKISDIDGPRIDDEAASIVVDEDKVAPQATVIFPGEFWIFLLLAYVALLIFNLSYTFEKVIEPQWFWESLYTLLALTAWLFLDPTALYTWFPFMVIKLGLIIFALYVYLLEKRGVPDSKEPKTEPLF